ncbi:beta-1,4-glucuronyltransferase 1 isoform X2 [Plodia interpunctella]|uniref:beta-1,4-glucuronyltransferase 1 isoform X2 n=1 Tax=Plodia interpunctella TaxID=58824 RepID=UPI002367BEF4|nr:beta-1,4-glucuronyltransferase 1 isoform X2 [Plodia interpunctella]
MSWLTRVFIYEVRPKHHDAPPPAVIHEAAMGSSPHPTAKMRKSKFWRGRCQWSVVTVIAIALVVYNAAANVWMLRPASCPVLTTQPAPDPPSCEPCVETASASAIEDDPIAKLNLRLGRWDKSRSYRMFDYAAVGETYAESSANNLVCLATQTSIERLHELLKIAAHWTGPISVSVFVAGDELKLLRAFTTWLIRCKHDVATRLAIHVATPVEKPANHGKMPVWARDCGSWPLPPLDRRTETVVWRLKNPYPQNHLRNLARTSCQTPYVFLVDVDIVPSRDMTESLNKFLKSTPKCRLCAYVVPTYELDKRVANFPANKTELLRLSKNKLAIPFHRKVFIYNQYASNFSRWEQSGGNESSDTHISHNVTNFELLYEPFYVAPDTVPAHDERFLGYGFTRNSQVYEMFLIGYQFKVLSPIFTIHWGLQGRKSRPLWREKQNEKNRKNFETFKRELFARYRRDPLHLLKRPPQIKSKS